MPNSRLLFQTELPVPAQDAFDWHTRPGAFERFTPAWETVEVFSQSGSIRNGDQVRFRIRMAPGRWIPWTAEYQNVIEGSQFQDRAVESPFAFWLHTHRLTPLSGARCHLSDDIEYALPFGMLGRFFGEPFVRRKFTAVFRYRHRIILDDLTVWSEHKERGQQRMRILVSGASGMVGSALVPFLTTQGHEVIRLGRGTPGKGVNIQWDPDRGILDLSQAGRIDAVVHLAGENIAAGRWNDEKKCRIRDSRVKGTRLLSEAIAALPEPPQVMVMASAIGFYGNRGEEALTEDSPPGNEYLSEVCREWEAAARPATDRGIRVVQTRFGMILSPRGGALGKILPPFQLGGGGNLGSGQQYMSWVAIDDVVGAIYHALQTPTLNGPVNVVSPQPVRNREFTKILGKVLFRPTIAPVPAFAVRLLFGEMADALLLSSTRVLPTRLESSGYRFRFPDLEGALRHLLGKVV